MRGHVTLTVQVNAIIIERQASGDIDAGVVHDTVVQLAMVDRRRETVQVGDEHVDIVLVRVFFRHVDHREHCSEIVANVQVVVGTDAGENNGFSHG